MGTKEEGYPIIIRRGWAGQIKPLQANAGPCQSCKEDVWVSPPSKTVRNFQAIHYYHHSCRPHSPKAQASR